MELYGSLSNISGSVTASAFTGSFIGDGSGLTGIQAAGVVGLNLSQIATGSFTASLSPNGFNVNTNTSITGAVNITGSISLNGEPIGTGKLNETTFNSYTSSISSSIGGLSSSIASTDNTQNGRLDSLETASGSIRTDFNSFTSSYTTVSGSLDSRLDTLENTTSSTNLNYIDFDTTPSVSSIEGRLLWNNVDGTLDLGLKGGNVTLQVGQETLYEVRNETGIQIPNGTAVYANGVTVGSGRITVAPFTSNGTIRDINFLGLATENISNGVNGYVTHFGYTRGLDTRGTAASSIAVGDENWSVGDILYAHPTAAGKLTNVKPKHEISVAIIINRHQSSGVVFVRPISFGHLFDNHDVDINTGSITTGDLLIYDSGNSVWRNSKSLEGNYLVSGSVNITGGLTGSIDYSNITNKPTLVSSSVQVTTYGFATTGSNLFIGTQTHSGSILPSVDNAYDLGSPTYQWRDVYISSGSLYIDGTKVLSSTAQELTITTDTGQSIKILEGTTDSIILQTADGDIELKSSADGDILLDPTYGKIMLKGTIEVFNGNKIQSSVGGTPVVFANDIVVSGSIELTGTVDGIDLTAFSSSLNGRLGSLESSGGSLNEFTSSAIGRLNALETTTSSLNTYTSSNNTRLGVIEGTTSSLNTYTSSADGRLSSIETTTGSILSVNTTQNGRLDSLETTSGSILSANTTQNGRLDSIEGKTGSYATTGSNIFQGNQIITGSLFVSQDLIIAGSSSIQNISSSVLNIADNIITVNALNPSVRFGGLAVIDSGSSPQLSGSLLFDSVKNEWIFVHQNQGTVTSSVLLMGPETYDNLGNEAYITANRLVKSTGIEHLTNSNISDDGTTVTILSNAVVNGTFSATGTTLVSGSSQISHDSTTGYVANRHIDHTSVSISAGNGLSGGGDISTTRTLTLDTSSATFTSGVKSKMNADGVVSGSSQVSFNGITDKPTLVSGSSQITYGSLSGIPSGIVSGSSQITFGSINGIPGGLVSGSSQIDLTATTNYSSGIKTRLNAEGVLSGSSQVVAALPAGTVSGSAQITISSTTGYGSVLNQAVLTSSSPTFAGLTNNGTYTQSTTSTQPLTINGDSGDTNGLFRIQMDSISDSFASGARTFLGDGGIDIFLGTSNSSYTPSNTYIALNHSGEISMGAGSANKHFTLSTSGNLTISGTIGASNFSGSSSGTNTGDQTLNSLGALSSNTDSEQVVGCHDVFWNYGTGVIKSDARWNESGYDADLGTLHLYSTTAAGANYGRAGIALYHGSAYQYLTTKASTTGLFVNNSLILTAGNYTSYAMAGAGYSANQNLNTTSSPTFAGLSSNGTITITSGTPTGAASNNANSYLRIDSAANQYIELRTNASASGAMQGMLFTDNGVNGFIGFKEYTGGSNYGEAIHISVTDYSSSDAGNGIYLGASSNNANGVTTPWFSIRGGTSYFYGNVLPDTNNSRNLGSASVGWANVYTNDLHLSNMNKPEGNDVDGTNGNWTIQEGAENLYIINNNNGKKFKISLEEII
jgi:hypothetical protein